MLHKKKHIIAINKCLAFFLLLFITQTIFCAKTFAQVQQLIDSLEKQLPINADTNKAKILNDLTWFYRTVSQEKAIEYGIKAIQFSQQINYEKGVAQAYNDLGIIYTDKRDYTTAIDYLDKSLVIRKSQKDEKGIAAIYNKLGIINQEKGNAQEALKYQFEALKLFEKLRLDIPIANSLNNIAILFYNNNNNSKSLEYHKRAIALRIKISDKLGVASSYVNIGNIYIEDLDFVKAYENFLEATNIMRSLGEKAFLAIALNNLATACQKLNKFNDALKYATESYIIRKENNDLKGVASAALNLAVTKIHFKDYVAAKKYIDEAYILGIKANTKPEIKYAYETYSRLYEEQGNSEKALYFMKKFVLLNDTILNEDNNKQMAEMSTRFEVEKKENDNKRLASENQIKSLEITKQQQYKYLALAGIILVLISALLLYNRYKHKQEKLLSNELLKQEQLRLKAIIITQENERKRIAEELHDGIGQMMSAVKMNVASLDVLEEDKAHFEKTLSLIDDSCSELRNISHAMMPSALSKLGFISAIKELIDSINSSKKININFLESGLNTRLNEIVEVNLYRIVQEILQNILKYAQANEVQIKIAKNGNQLQLSINDDGVGFDAKILKTNSGNGWNNINSRITVINAKINVESAVNRGTKINIEIPLT